MGTSDSDNTIEKPTVIEILSVEVSDSDSPKKKTPSTIAIIGGVLTVIALIIDLVCCFFCNPESVGVETASKSYLIMWLNNIFVLGLGFFLVLFESSKDW